jgi:hypothetical protein
VTVNFATSDGTASAGSDYIATNGKLTFQPGTAGQTFTVPILKGVVSGATGKTINLSLSSPQLAEMGVQDTAVLTISQNKVIFLPLLSR